MADGDQPRRTRKSAESSDSGADAVQSAFDAAQEKGYFGETPDPTPNENYTLAGVTSGAPTPETDEDLRVEARAATRRNR